MEKRAGSTCGSWCKLLYCRLPKGKLASLASKLCNSRNVQQLRLCVCTDLYRWLHMLRIEHILMHCSRCRGHTWLGYKHSYNWCSLTIGGLAPGTKCWLIVISRHCYSSYVCCSTYLDRVNIIIYSTALNRNPPSCLLPPIDYTARNSRAG